MNFWVSTIYTPDTGLTNFRDDFKALPQNPAPSPGFNLPQIITCNRERMAAPAFTLNFYPLPRT